MIVLRASQGVLPRWLVEAEIAELLLAPMDKKLQQTGTLMASLQDMGWDNTMDSDEAEVWSHLTLFLY